jgi:hypothetical protein
MSKKYLFFIFIIVTALANAQVADTIQRPVDIQSYTLSNGAIYTYKKPKFFSIVTKIPSNVVSTFHDFGKTNNMIGLAGATVATVALLPADQKLLENSIAIGEDLGMASVARYKNFGPLSNIPPNATSAIYLIGNGTTPIMLSMGLATYGLINNDYRSLNTATGLMESLIVCGVFSQTIKRITGRQSPAPALIDGNDGGSWTPFPSIIAYTKHTPRYDAMPSGHMMTATASLYVIMGNYPEKKWIRPVGYTLIGALGFQMVQSSVHWVSDYPIALVMGYIIGKNITRSNVAISNTKKTTPKKYAFNLDAYRQSGINMIGARITF